MKYEMEPIPQRWVCWRGGRRERERIQCIVHFLTKTNCLIMRKSLFWWTNRQEMRKYSARKHPLRIEWRNWVNKLHTHIPIVLSQQQAHSLFLIISFFGLPISGACTSKEELATADKHSIWVGEKNARERERKIECVWEREIEWERDWVSEREREIERERERNIHTKLKRRRRRENIRWDSVKIRCIQRNQLNMNAICCLHFNGYLRWDEMKSHMKGIEERGERENAW